MQTNFFLKKFELKNMFVINFNYEKNVLNF